MNLDELLKIPIFLNLFLLTGLCLYVILKARRDVSVLFFLLSLLPLLLFESGSLAFILWPASTYAVVLLFTALALLPLTLTPASQSLARNSQVKISRWWKAYYALQLLVFAVFMEEILRGRVLDWVTGILDQPVLIIEKSRRFFLLNTGICLSFALLGFENTLRNGTKLQQEKLRYIVIGYLGIIFYFFYVCAQIVFSSYVTQAMLLSGSALILAGLVFIVYSLAKYPFWELKIFISRRVVVGCLSVSALILYLIASGWIMGFLYSVQTPELSALLPVALFFIVAVLLYVYLSPTVKNKVAIWVTRNFFREKYDYRYLWMKFSEKIGGSLNLSDILEKLGQFISDTLVARQVIIWLPTPASPDVFSIAYCLDDVERYPKSDYPIRHAAMPSQQPLPEIIDIAATGGVAAMEFLAPQKLKELQLDYLIPVRKTGDLLAWLGIGNRIGRENLSTEDQQLLISISNQLANLILTAKLAGELLEAREWESFNRLSSFLIHDLKNLATQQSMVLQNAKDLGDNPAFLQDAFATFGHTTDKMISLIANLSVQKGQLVSDRQPVNVVDLLKTTFDELKIYHRKGLQVTTDFPLESRAPTVSGDPILLQKAFTNILLNAVQSLPNGEGSIEVAVYQPDSKIITAFSDTGYGMSSETLRNLFRPFHTTKKGGMGIGLCHTRTIVESHGGRIRIDSAINKGTKVEIELPARL